MEKNKKKFRELSFSEWTEHIASQVKNKPQKEKDPVKKEKKERGTKKYDTMGIEMVSKCCGYDYVDIEDEYGECKSSL